MLSSSEAGGESNFNHARIIPCLLLQGGALVKTIGFDSPKYLGDPVNIVRIFNEKEADEILLLDIDASVRLYTPDYGLLENIASECFMPLSYGGGVKDIEVARRILKSGFEKICVNSAAIENPELVSFLAREFGSSSVIVSIDAQKRKNGKYEVMLYRGRKPTGIEPARMAIEAEERGAGEILINSIDRDGRRAGYDLDLIKSISSAVSVPVIAAGGAGSLADLVEVILLGGAAAAAAGSFFVFHGPYRSVLINMPERRDYIASLEQKASKG